MRVITSLAAVAWLTTVMATPGCAAPIGPGLPADTGTDPMKPDDGTRPEGVPRSESDGEPFGDCRDAERSCYAPFSCAPEDIGGDPYHCTSSSHGQPICFGNPSNLALTVETNDAGIPLHMLLTDRCVPVTYASSATVLLGQLMVAVEEWNSVSCNQLCFSSPRPSDRELETERFERRIHIAVRPPDSSYAATSTTLYELESGRMVGMEIDIHPDQVEAFGAGEVLALFMMAMGFRPAETADSVIRTNTVGGDEHRSGWLGTDDREAICAMYGTPSFCAGDELLF